MAEGRYTEEELIRQEMQHGMPLAKTALLMCVVVGPLIWKGLPQGAPLWLAVGPLIGGVTLVLGVISMAQRWHARSVVARRADLGATLRFIFDADGLTIHAALPTDEATTARMPWAEILSVSQRGDVAVLRHRAGTDVLLPRRFFADDSVWRSFFAFARTRIPPGAKQKPFSRLQLYSEHVGAPPTGPQALPFDAEVTADDVRTGVAAATRGPKTVVGGAPGVPWWVHGVFLVAAAIVIFDATDVIRLFAWVAALVLDASPTSTAVLLLLLGVPVVAVTLTLLRRRTRKPWRQRLVLAREGVFVWGEEGWARLPWATFQGCGADDERVWLDFGQQQFLVLPMRGFENAEAGRKAAALAQRRLGRCACGYPYRGVTADACPECGAAIGAAG